MRVLGLFSGIGGFEQGFEKAGHETALLCENDQYASDVLKRHHSHVGLVDDIRNLKRIPKNVDIVTAGFPCQNISMAGDKTGIYGPKSSIVDELFSLLKGRRVPCIVIENVYFMLHLKKGAGMEYILSRLEKLGYKWAYRVIDSRSFGLAQRRRRVFIVASLEGDPRSNVLTGDIGKIDWPKPSLDKPIGFYWTEGASGHGLTADATPPLKTGSALGIPSPPAVLLPTGRIVTPSIEAAERLQGFPAGWTSHLRKIGHEKYRWKLVGNAVSVPIAEWLGNQISSPQQYDDKDDTVLMTGEPWPIASWNVGYGRYKSTVSENPIKVRRGRLSAFKTSDWPDLSKRALSGFLDRARRSSLRYPPEFLKALENGLKKL